MCRPCNLFSGELAQVRRILWQGIRAETQQMTKSWSFREGEKAPPEQNSLFSLKGHYQKSLLPADMLFAIEHIGRGRGYHESVTT